MNSNTKYFDKLGIHPTTNLDQIKKAYRRQALRFHPDKNNSPNAQEKFIEITEAYEILTGVASQQKAFTYTGAGKTAEDIRREKMNRARERYQEMQQKELEKDAAYYAKITSGWRWMSFRIMAYYTCMLSILLSIDQFTSSKKVISSEFKQDYHVGNSIAWGGELFVLDDENFWYNPEPLAEYNYSVIFGDLNSVRMIDQSKEIGEIRKPSDRNKRYILFNQANSKLFYAYGSVYSFFPFPQLGMFIPLLLVLYKRPRMGFSLIRLVSIWVIFPFVIYFTLVNGRIFHLFGIF